MNKNIFYLCLVPCVLCLVSCSKQDPILPGTRTPIFQSAKVVVEKGEIPKEVLEKSFAKVAVASPDTPLRFEQNLDNEIFEISDSGNRRKIFSGFPTTGKIDVPRQPVFYNGNLYAGLTTGELIKINPTTRRVVWIADIFNDTDMLGGGSVLDIVAPVVIDSNRVFAGGMGRAFCRLDISNGDKKWCADISVATPFTVVHDLAFVIGVDKTLYALDSGDGTVYWTAKTKKLAAPKLESKDGNYFISVGKEKFEALSGTRH